MAHRSPNFPAIGLKEAVERAKMLYDKDGTAGSTKESVFKNMGYTGRHGVSLGVLSALGKFGLTEEKNGRIVLTKDSVIILLKGGNEQQRRSTIKRCALKPDLYKKLWEDHAEHGALPGDDTLRSLLVSMEFNPKSLDKVVSAFRETIDFAGLSYESDERSENGDQADADSMGTVDQGILAPAKSGTDQRTPQVRDFAIPRKGDKLAILRLELPVSDDDVGRIGKWLELMKGTISDE